MGTYTRVALAAWPKDSPQYEFLFQPNFMGIYGEQMSSEIQEIASFIMQTFLENFP